MKTNSENIEEISDYQKDIATGFSKNHGMKEASDYLNTLQDVEKSIAETLDLIKKRYSELGDEESNPDNK